MRDRLGIQIGQFARAALTAMGIFDSPVVNETRSLTVAIRPVYTGQSVIDWATISPALPPTSSRCQCLKD